jgi:hypothetical protein
MEGAQGSAHALFTPIGGSEVRGSFPEALRGVAATEGAVSIIELRKSA